MTLFKLEEMLDQVLLVEVFMLDHTEETVPFMFSHALDTPPLIFDVLSPMTPSIEFHVDDVLFEIESHPNEISDRMSFMFLELSSLVEDQFPVSEFLMESQIDPVVCLMLSHVFETFSLIEPPELSHPFLNPFTNGVIMLSLTHCGILNITVKTPLKVFTINSSNPLIVSTADLGDVSQSTAYPHSSPISVDLKFLKRLYYLSIPNRTF